MAIFWVIFWIRTASRRFHLGIVDWNSFCWVENYTTLPCMSQFSQPSAGGNQTQKWHHDILEIRQPIPNNIPAEKRMALVSGDQSFGSSRRIGWRTRASFFQGSPPFLSMFYLFFYLFWFCQIKYILRHICTMCIYIYGSVTWMVISQNGYNRYWCQER